MLQNSLRAPVTRIITPVCRGLLRLGLSANAVSAMGAMGSLVSAIYFFSRGKFFLGVVITLIFVLSDALDGTMARLSDTGSKWGALLDSTLDRITDAAVLGSLAYWLSQTNDRLLPVVLTALVCGNLVSYIKARAESLGIECNGGFAERTERLVITFISLALAGLSIPFALAIGMWILAFATLFTTMERLAIVYKATR
ncbi:MAG: CDP-alcohol phosphatidyltransferase family protein [Actinomycetes bacterium]